MGRKGVIAGWGKTSSDLSSGHTGTAILQTASVPIISMLRSNLFISKNYAFCSHVSWFLIGFVFYKF